ncbi:MAG: type II toxin-antitoxin system HicA family toxin [Fibromonadaceae bacterium]|jgi:predicted RNA binding protein YcfA (HicA-like mRNA interferase family)|nr:type II toxin-antitoxin system HicA family toxin [Fibromonadaceae bacterium]
MNAKELFRIAKKNGFALKRISGSHHIFEKNGHIVPIPFHAGKDLKTGLVNAILKQLGAK